MATHPVTKRGDSQTRFASSVKVSLRPRRVGSSKPHGFPFRRRWYDGAGAEMPALYPFFLPHACFSRAMCFTAFVVGSQEPAPGWHRR